MFETELPSFESDIREVISAMDAGDLKIKHLFSHKDGKIVNTVVINGKAYAYGNFVGVFDDKIVEKRIIKRYAKLSMYKALSLYLGKTLPWGALTGIRPTKLAYAQIEETGEFKDFFINTMKVSEEKTSLVQKVIDAQKGVYEKNRDNTDFFVFVPFCPTRCEYCSFISSDMRTAKKYVDAYVDTLVREIRESAKYVKKLRSIYVGGGTPVALPDDKLALILNELDKINTGVEYTVEAGRPDAITKENLALLKSHGVTRICINPQTMNDKTLAQIGRKHTAKDVIEKFDLARGTFSINSDLIAGLTGETAEDFKRTLDAITQLDPDGITVHTLCLKRGSRLSEEVEKLSERETEQMVSYALSSLTEKGYSPYYLYRQKYSAGNLENVGYCKSGKQCVYNVDVMEEISRNVACGANAISKEVRNDFELINRSANPKDVPTYIASIEKLLNNKRKLFEN